MAVWEVRTVVRYGDRHWENVWHVEIGSATDVPPALVDAFVTFGRNTLLDLYTLERVVRRPAGSHDMFIEDIVGLAGILSSDGFKALPIFNVVKVLLQVGLGRPGIKLLRGAIIDGDLLDEQFHLKPTFVTLIQNELNALYNAASDAACEIVVGSTNKPSVTSNVDTTIQMRQPHRKRRKPLV